MKNNKLKQYITLRDALQRERAALESRLKEINEALGVPAPAGGGSAAAAAPSRASAGRRKGPRRMSAEARAKISEAQRQRWAKVKGTSSSTAAVRKSRRHGMTPEQREKIAAAQRARWARYRASKGK